MDSDSLAHFQPDIQESSSLDAVPSMDVSVAKSRADDRPTIELELNKRIIFFSSVLTQAESDTTTQPNRYMRFQILMLRYIRMMSFDKACQDAIKSNEANATLTIEEASLAMEYCGRSLAEFSKNEQTAMIAWKNSVDLTGPTVKLPLKVAGSIYQILCSVLRTEGYRCLLSDEEDNQTLFEEMTQAPGGLLNGAQMLLTLAGFMVTNMRKVPVWAHVVSSEIAQSNRGRSASNQRIKNTNRTRPGVLTSKSEVVASIQRKNSEVSAQPNEINLELSRLRNEKKSFDTKIGNYEKSIANANNTINDLNARYTAQMQAKEKKLDETRGLLRMTQAELAKAQKGSTVSSAKAPVDQTKLGRENKYLKGRVAELSDQLSDALNDCNEVQVNFKSLQVKSDSLQVKYDSLQTEIRQLRTTRENGVLAQRNAGTAALKELQDEIITLHTKLETAEKTAEMKANDCKRELQKLRKQRMEELEKKDVKIKELKQAMLEVEKERKEQVQMFTGRMSAINEQLKILVKLTAKEGHDV